MAVTAIIETNTNLKKCQVRGEKNKAASKKKRCCNLFEYRQETWFKTFFQEKIEVRIHIIVKLIAMIGLILTILDLTLEYNESPTLTTLESDSYPAQEVDFPGIAICSTNRISQHAINEFAEELYGLETTKIFNITFNEMRDLLKYLGNLYVFDVDEDEVDDALLLHAILSRAYGDYNVDEFMMQLTPKCRTLLKYCAWEGKDRVCDNMFFLRKTQDGFCCTFNYARRTDDFGSTKRSGFVSSTVERSTLISPDLGLSVVLDSAAEDCYYKSVPSNGFKVLIFSSLDYPDASSGSLREIFVPEKSEVFISMDATSFHSVPEVAEYDVSQRNCLFNTEQDKIFQGYYSYSDCIMYCRIRDIVRQCKCVPFFYPRPESSEPTKSCNLDDLLCLKEFIIKWRQIQPRLKTEPFVYTDDEAKSSSNHLHCDCFPSCDDVSYKVSSSTISLTTDHFVWDRFLVRNRNYSILHVYFDGPSTIRLKQDVLFYWYELMSDYGGICSLFLGVSIINAVEIIYACCLRLIFNRGRRRGSAIDPAEADNVADLAAAAKTFGAMQNEAPRLNAVKVIDIREPPLPPPPQTPQLYWQEFVKPIKPLF